MFFNPTVRCFQPVSFEDTADLSLGFARLSNNGEKLVRGHALDLGSINASVIA